MVNAVSYMLDSHKVKTIYLRKIVSETCFSIRVGPRRE